jgi:uncharacterized protein with HEPN domain
MTEKEKKFLSDILTAIELIETFVASTTSFSDYTKDLKTKSATERQLAIIGEAVNKFQKESNSSSLKNVNQIISLRNRLIHSYDNVDDSIIWSIVTRHLQPLKTEVKNLIDQP